MRILLLSLSIFLMAGFVQAQVGIGFKGGSNFSAAEIYKRPSYRGYDVKSIQGFQFGAVIRYMSEKHAGLNIELLYTQKGWRKVSFNDETDTETRTINYLELPLMTHFSIGKNKVRIILEGGAYISYALSSKIYYNDSATNAEITEDFKFQEGIDNRWDYGLLGSAGFQFYFPFGAIEAKAFYSYGYGNIFLDKSEAVEISQNRVYGINLNYIYFFPIKEKD